MQYSSSFKVSRYNFRIPTNNGELIYNARTGAIVCFSDSDSVEVAKKLTCFSGRIQFHRQYDEFMEDLLQGGFIIHSSENELGKIREKFKYARSNSSLVVTITTTIDCNLGCYYCYESRSDEQLQSSDLPMLLRDIKRALVSKNKKSLHIDWYGGEPLLNIDFIEEASLEIQKLCKDLNIKYNSSIISNGTCWPEDVSGFIQRHKIRQVQISFDGMEEKHNKRRRYVDKASAKLSSFNIASKLVDKLVNCCKVDIRYNIDKHNVADLELFIKYASNRGWFKAKFEASLQPARIASYTDQSGFVKKHQLSLEYYDAVRSKTRASMEGIAPVQEAESPDGFPHPKSTVCSALANESFVVGARGNIYKCGLQVGEQRFAVSKLSNWLGNLIFTDNENSSLSSQKEQREWWEDFDPTKNKDCSRCSFLPVCWGGCPKKHLDNDIDSIAEQGKYWRNNLARLVTEHLEGFKLRYSDFSFQKSDQFR